MQAMKIVLLTLLLLIAPTTDLLAQAKESATYYESGALHFEYSYLNGELHGTTREYYETGELKAEHVYQNGQLISKKEYHRNGDLEYEMKYEDGHKIETQIEYYQTGQLFRQRSFLDGNRHGLEIEFYRNGQKKAERNYKYGKKEGSAKGYHSNGKLQGDWIFKNDEPVSATIYYNTGEKWLVHTQFDKDGRLNGVSKEYDKAGNLIAKRYYKDDQLIQRKRVDSWWEQWW